MKGFVKKTTSDRRFWAVLYVLMALLGIISIYEGIANGIVWSQDFQYDAATALVNGYDPYDMSMDFDESRLPDIAGLKGFYEYYDGLGTPQKMEANQFPSLLYILTPYTLLPYGAARILWVVTNILCTAVIIWLLKKTFMTQVDERLYPVFMLLMLAGTPWRNQIGVGQHTLFAASFFLLAVYVSDQRDIKDDTDTAGSGIRAGGSGWRVVASGLLLSLSYLKYTVTAPLALYFIYKKKWKAFVISLVPHILLTGTASLILHEPYTDMLIKPLRVASALAGEGSIDIGALTGGSPAGLIVTAAAMIFLFTVAVMMPEGNDELFISVAALLSLVMTYHRTYDFFIMIIVFGYFATGRMKTAEIIYLITTLAFFFVLRVFHENIISLTVSGALYYACVISFVVVSIDKIRRR
ncbi:MAG: DUF2029 domain-containing protein [Lachnospiraceae bacterium]|nr:DUF2029 domain-containing protein [Lachnospiraceae bacterium]MBR1523585.1 DUF2029 domain-containing protein [Lachnospiraceae bacterium]